MSLKVPDVVAESAPADPAGAPAVPDRLSRRFSPTDRHRWFLYIASKCQMEHLCMVRDWLVDEENKESDDPVSAAEWRTWAQEAGFKDWFYSNLPLPRSVDLSEVADMDPLFWSALRNRMIGGDTAALGLFAKITGKEPEKDADTGKSDVHVWLESQGGAAWVPQPRRIVSTDGHEPG